MLSYLKSLFKKDNEHWKSILPVLESGKEDELKTLLWGAKNKEVNFLPITFSMLQKLAKPEGTNSGLKIYRTHRKGNFLLIIFEQPWIKDDLPYSPVIVDLRSSKIAGIMLPFNEIAPFLSKADSNAMGDLAVIWTKWCFDKKFGS